MKINEIRALTGASRPTIYRWMKSGDFPASNRGIWDRDQVENWWKQNRERIGRWPKEHNTA